MKRLYLGDDTVKTPDGKAPEESVWANAFNSDTNYNAIKVEAGNAEVYSKVYELDKDSGVSLKD